MQTTCVSCGRSKRLKAKGVCSGCYNRANKHRWNNRAEAPERKSARYRRSSWVARTLHGGGGGSRYGLSKDYMESLQQEHPLCECCCVVLDFKCHRGRGSRPLNQATLDKVVPSLGYVVGNVAVLCWRCNRNKRDMRLEDLQCLAAYVERKTSELLKG